MAPLSMPALSPDRDRLDLLNQAHPGRPWRSCAEKRRCVGCDRIFRGDEAVLNPGEEASRLACPGCGSRPALWVRLGNPLVNAQVWAEWESALDRLGDEELDDSDGGLATAR